MEDFFNALPRLARRCTFGYLWIWSTRQVRTMKIDKTLINSYPFTIRPLSEEDGGGFAIEYPDLPGCISDGDTPQEALKNGCDAVKSYLLSCVGHGDPIPKLSDREACTPALPREQGRRALA